MAVCSGVKDGKDEMGVRRVVQVGDLAPSPGGREGVELFATWDCACELHPGVCKEIVGGRVIWGYNSSVGGCVPGFCSEGTGEGPVDGPSGVLRGGEGVDQSVAQPGACIWVLGSPKEGIRWMCGEVGVGRVVGQGASWEVCGMVQLIPGLQDGGVEGLEGGVLVAEEQSSNILFKGASAV